MSKDIQNIHYRLRKRGLAVKGYAVLHEKMMEINGFIAYWEQGHVIIEFSAHDEDEFYRQLNATIKVMQEELLGSPINSLLEVKIITGEWKSVKDSTRNSVYVPIPFSPQKSTKLYEKFTTVFKDEEMLIKNEDKELYEMCLKIYGK